MIEFKSLLSMSIVGGVLTAFAAHLPANAQTSSSSNWIRLPIPVPPSASSRIVADSSGGILYCTPDGVYRTDDHGFHWDTLVVGPSYAVGSLDEQDQYFKVGSCDPGPPICGQAIERSTDWGVSWEDLIIGGLKTIFDWAHVVQASGNVCIEGLEQGGGTRGILCSTDGGESWERAIGLPNQYVYAFGIVEIGNNIIMVEWTHTIHKSSDDGATWMSTYQGTNVRGLTVDPYAQTVWMVDVDTYFKSTDLGETWEMLSAPSSGNNPSRTIFTPNSTMYSKAADSLFVSNDSAVSWRNATGDLNYGIGLDVISDVDGYVYFSTTTGLYRTLATMTEVGSSEEVPISFGLLQNYPNPFNPTTTFSFSVPQSSIVNLTIFDLLGREVATIVNERLGAGVYTRQWDATGLASGVYVYRLTAGDYVETRKLALIR